MVKQYGEGGKKRRKGNSLKRKGLRRRDREKREREG